MAQNKYFQSAMLAVGALLLLVVSAIILFYIRVGNIPDFNGCMCAWDCGWYYDIMQNGYSFKPGNESNPAFFPLFPYVWRALGASAMQMSLFNALLFVVTFSWLSGQFNWSIKEQLVFCGTGLITFFVVPYSECLFFVGSALFLVGLHKHRTGFTVLGFVVAVLSRSAAIIFIAASTVLLIYAIIRKDRPKQKLLLISVITSAFTTLAVLCIQYFQTGNFFAFFDAQKFWDHHLGIPSIPLTSWHWPTHISDSAALMIGLSAIIICAVFCLRMFVTVKDVLFEQTSTLSYAYLFALLYLAGTTATILLFQGGNLHSLNRYIFSTPFFGLLIHAFATGKLKVKFKLQHYLIACVLIGIIMPRQTYIEHYLLITVGIMVIPAAVFFQSLPLKHPWLKVLPLLLGFIYQIVLFSLYLEGNWMG
jgi:hypothetical protein